MQRVLSVWFLVLTERDSLYLVHLVKEDKGQDTVRL